MIDQQHVVQNMECITGSDLPLASDVPRFLSCTKFSYLKHWNRWTEW